MFGQSRNCTLSSVTTNGSTLAGATEVSFANSGSGAAIVAGGPLLPGQSVTFTATAPDTLNAISYTATGTTLLISVVA
jgi:hypothetical protein